MFLFYFSDLSNLGDLNDLGDLYDPSDISDLVVFTGVPLSPQLFHSFISCTHTWQIFGAEL